ncbi:tRNA pseudouridine(38-40) synthase TruA [Thermopirellula anaerolimosa]
MRCIRLRLAYDGTDYDGWQSQKSGRSIQDAVEAAAARLIGHQVRVLASGRTDAGVHALGQVAAFRTEKTFSPEVIRKALNARLPDDIVILSAEEVSAEFHPIRDAKRKHYRYLLSDAAFPNVFLRRYVWRYPRPLDATAMERAAEALCGTHDFSAFQSAGSQRATTVRTIYDLRVARSRSIPHLITIDVTANGFLYNMMRNIVGSLVDVGRGTRPPSWIAEVLEQRDRRRAGATAPPHGLFLISVTYPDDAAPACDAHLPWSGGSYPEFPLV